MIRKFVTSTDIRNIGYQNGTLEIEFINGGIYTYPNVPREHYAYMISHAHPGTYFQRYIKPYYPYSSKR
jgi:hypothetical protein